MLYDLQTVIHDRLNSKQFDKTIDDEQEEEEEEEIDVEENDDKKTQDDDDKEEEDEEDKKHHKKNKKKQKEKKKQQFETMQTSQSLQKFITLFGSDIPYITSSQSPEIETSEDEEVIVDPEQKTALQILRCEKNGKNKQKKDKEKQIEIISGKEQDKLESNELLKEEEKGIYIDLVRIEKKDKQQEEGKDNSNLKEKIKEKSKEKQPEEVAILHIKKKIQRLEKEKWITDQEIEQKKKEKIERKLSKKGRRKEKKKVKEQDEQKKLQRLKIEQLTWRNKFDVEEEMTLLDHKYEKVQQNEKVEYSKQKKDEKEEQNLDQSSSSSSESLNVTLEQNPDEQEEIKEEDEHEDYEEEMDESEEYEQDDEFGSGGMYSGSSSRGGFGGYAPGRGRGGGSISGRGGMRSSLRQRENTSSLLASALQGNSQIRRRGRCGRDYEWMESNANQIQSSIGQFSDGINWESKANTSINPSDICVLQGIEREYGEEKASQISGIAAKLGRKSTAFKDRVCEVIKVDGDSALIRILNREQSQMEQFWVNKNGLKQWIIPNDSIIDIIHSVDIEKKINYLKYNSITINKKAKQRIRTALLLAEFSLSQDLAHNALIEIISKIPREFEWNRNFLCKETQLLTFLISTLKGTVFLVIRQPTEVIEGKLKQKQKQNNNIEINQQQTLESENSSQILKKPSSIQTSQQNKQQFKTERPLNEQEQIASLTRRIGWWIADEIVNGTVNDKILEVLSSEYLEQNMKEKDINKLEKEKDDKKEKDYKQTDNKSNIFGDGCLSFLLRSLLSIVSSPSSVAHSIIASEGIGLRAIIPREDFFSDGQVNKHISNSDQSSQSVITREFRIPSFGSCQINTPKQSRFGINSSSSSSSQQSSGSKPDKTTQLNETIVVESQHPYLSEISDYNQDLIIEGANGLIVQFDKRCRTQSSHGQLEFKNFETDDILNSYSGSGSFQNFQVPN
ncbi:MAG: hypothetical protein EZS28_029106, partial [Streblomastix strix]